MTLKKLIETFEKNKNEDNAQKQAKYLKNKFNFLGLPKPVRSELEKEFINSFKHESIDNIMKVVIDLHNMPQREYMYTAQTLLLKNIKKLKYHHLYQIMDLTLINSWWENTDGYNMIIKRFLKANPDYIEQFIQHYYQEENFWLRRQTIICQLSLKELTNFEEMKKTIMYSINDEEFFIQKAIGWSLREYSKTYPQKVIEFLDQNRNNLSKLAIKEATKYL